VRRRRVFPLRRGYSLAALFLLIATVAVLAAMASTIPLSGNVPDGVVAANLIVGFLGGALIGGTIGIHYERRIRSTAVGALVGSLAGLTGGALTVSNFSPFMAVVQSAVLVGLAVAVRMTSPTRPRLRRVPPAAPPPPTRLAHANRTKLVAALLMTGCTLLAIARLVDGILSDGLASGREWAQAAAGFLVVLSSLGVTIYLVFSALRAPAAPPPPPRTSPWD
jgi:hypothetical protein